MRVIASALLLAPIACAGLFGRSPPPTASPLDQARKAANALASSGPRAVEETAARAEAGDPTAQARLGLMYQYGYGVDPDPGEAYRWCLAAARQGHAAAQYHVATLYLRGAGVEKSIATAADWLRRSYEQQDQSALETFVELYVDPRSTPRRVSEAFDWLESGARLGLAPAQYGFSLVLRTSGEPRARDASVLFLEQSAAQGYVDAQRELGRVLLAGDPELGVEAEPEVAVAWLDQASRQGDARAMRLLGAAYMGGGEVQGDTVEAYKWFVLASSDSEASREDVHLLEAILSDAQWREGRARARRFSRDWLER